MTTATPGRGLDGRFTSGNDGWYAKRGKHRTAFEKAIKNKDITEITIVLLNMAKAGNMSAIRYLFDRCLGKIKEEIEISTPLIDIQRNEKELNDIALRLRSASSKN